jgi:hypothetical protein
MAVAMAAAALPITASATPVIDLDH